MPHLELVIPIHHLHVQISFRVSFIESLLDVYKEGDELIAHGDVEGEFYALLSVDDGALDMPVNVGVMRFVVGLNAY